MTIQFAKALIGLCIDEGLKQGILKNRGEFEELLDYLDKYFAGTGKMTSGSSEIPSDQEPEVDLTTEVEKYFQGLWPGMETAEQCNTDMHFTPPAIMRLVSHFYNLGLQNAK